MAKDFEKTGPGEFSVRLPHIRVRNEDGSIPFEELERIAFQFAPLFAAMMDAIESGEVDAAADDADPSEKDS